MQNQFALDLCAARRKAGFTQRDVAHLLDASQTTVSNLESGERCPSFEQVVTLSLIYGRSFESHYAEVMKVACGSLQVRIFSLPKPVRTSAGTFNRSSSIERLAQRLADHQARNGWA